MFVTITIILQTVSVFLSWNVKLRNWTLIPK